MCGRYALVSPGEVLAEELATEEIPALAPRYNIAPTQAAPVVRSEHGRRAWRMLTWGLVPAGGRHPGAARQINARSETARHKPAFRESFARPERRCLVPADGFYEWKAFGRRKQAFFVRRPDRRPMALAGLWAPSAGDRGQAPSESFAILTCDANRRLAPLHDRMPVILPREAAAAWLTGDDLEGLEALLRPAPEDSLEYFAVGRAVHHAGHDAPDCLEPAAPAEPAAAPRPGPSGGQGRLF